MSGRPYIVGNWGTYQSRHKPRAMRGAYNDLCTKRTLGGKDNDGCPHLLVRVSAVTLFNFKPCIWSEACFETSEPSAFQKWAGLFSLKRCKVPETHDVDIPVRDKIPCRRSMCGNKHLDQTRIMRSGPARFFSPILQTVLHHSEWRRARKPRSKHETGPSLSVSNRGCSHEDAVHSAFKSFTHAKNSPRLLGVILSRRKDSPS